MYKRWWFDSWLVDGSSSSGGGGGVSSGRIIRIYYLQMCEKQQHKAVIIQTPHI